jgi:Autochaperone Domain Type 1
VGPGPGTFISNGGVLRLDTVLNEGGAATRSDTLVVDGTSVGAGGPTSMAIRNAGGGGAETIGNGILVVQVLNPTVPTPARFHSRAALSPPARLTTSCFMAASLRERKVTGTCEIRS